MPLRLRPRLNVTLAAAVLILVLDVLHSALPRLAWQEPNSIWRPDPKVYADMPWPPAVAAPVDASPAVKLYFADCAVCHGPDGRGNGPSASSLIPRPRDFTAGAFKFKTTPAGAPASDDDLYRAIADGLRDSAMPAWKDLLSADQIRSLVGVVKAFAPSAPPPEALAVPERVAPSVDSVARGEKLYASAGCVTCHGDDLRGGQWLEDAKHYPVVSRDLTAPWTFRGGDSPQALWTRLTTGLAPGPMPSFADALTASERWDVVNFVLSKARVAPWAPGGKLSGPGEAVNLESRGRYLVRAEMCGLCHTEIDPGLIYRDDKYLGGGMRVGADPHGVFVSRNLTSDVATGLGGWSEAEIAHAFRDGRDKDGRPLDVSAMPWMYFHTFSDDDAKAIARYLKTLPAVHDAIPDELGYGFVETIARKLAQGGLPASVAPRLTYDIGSYANPAGFDWNAAQIWIVRLQWLALALGLVGFAWASGRPRGFGGVAKGVGLVAGLGVVLGVGYFLYATPALTLIPPEKIADAAAGAIRAPDVSAMSPEQAALAKRGQYLFTVASCALCHKNDGAGGLKVSSQIAGTQFARNLTSDKTFGLGAWSDDEIARAIRSGVSRDGRPLYWQAMPWDHFSNWDEEDIRALIAYLRALPPVAKQIPAATPPSPADCKIYTFFTSESLTPGCAM